MKRVTKGGYIDVWEPTHPLARADGYVFEHRKVAWEAGLLTDPSLVVHHVNGVKDDNRLENLEIKSQSDHVREHSHEHWTAVWAGRERPTASPREEVCSLCGSVIPPTKRRDALHCSKRCQITAWKRARRRGITSPVNRLTRGQVNEIRARLEAGELGTLLAVDYGVSKQTISNIRQGRFAGV